MDKTENFGSTIYTADFIPKNEFICLYNGYDNAFLDQGECMVLDASVMIYKDDDKFRVFHKSTRNFIRRIFLLDKKSNEYLNNEES